MTETYTISTARVLAPEDIAPGQFVAPLHKIHEYPARPPCDESGGSRDLGTLRWRVLASDGPYRVLEVCLPLVLVEDPDGMHEQLDTRDTTIARLSDAYGERAFAKDPQSAEPDFEALRARVLTQIGAR